MECPVKVLRIAPRRIEVDESSLLGGLFEMFFCILSATGDQYLHLKNNGNLEHTCHASTLSARMLH